ncbi:MAG: type II secretion system protein GspG [Victivallaceae bacterium]|nr:type II secretion system protein GspG [Victivallaceae bacterium]
MAKRFELFTLVELLVVIGIIAILAGLGMSGYGIAMRKAREARTVSTIQKLTLALENLKIKHGVYPVELPDNNTDGKYTFCFYEADKTKTEPDEIYKWYWKLNTAKDMKMGSVPRYTADFLKAVDLNALDFDDEGRLVDGWKKPFIYRCPGVVNTNSFDLISAGPDGKFGKNNLTRAVFLAGSDAASLEKAGRDAFVTNGEVVCDDITNFFN